MIFIAFIRIMIRYPFNEKRTNSNHCGVDIIYVLTSTTTRVTRKFTTLVTFVIQEKHDDLELQKRTICEEYCITFE